MRAISTNARWLAGRCAPFSGARSRLRGGSGVRRLSTLWWLSHLWLMRPLSSGCGQSTSKGEWSVSTIKPTSSPRGLQGRQIRQRPGRDDQWALQGRGDPSARAVEDQVGGGTGHSGTGALIQPSPLDGAAGVRGAGRVRNQLPLATRCSGRDRLTKSKRLPSMPGRFTKRVPHPMPRTQRTHEHEDHRRAKRCQL